MEVEQLTDEELAVRGGEGDQAAFTSLYERYFQRIYDFALRLTRDHDEAADVTQSTFLKAYQSLEQRDQNASFKSWLFTIAHHDALDRMRRGRRLVRTSDAQDEEGLAVLASDRLRDPLEAAERDEIGRLVWEAARGLKPREYALLDLYVRQGMDPVEISQITGVRRESVHTALSGLRGEFEEAFTALILVARGRSACEELAQLAGPPSPKVRERVMRHLEVCETCQESRRRYVTAVEFLGAMPPVVVLPALQDSILSHVLTHTGTAADTEAPVLDEGSPGVDALRRFWLRWRLALSAAAVVVASLLFFGVVMAQRGSGGGEQGPRDPQDIRSTSHEVGVPSQEQDVVIVWTPLDDLLGYSVRWSQDPDALPDTTRDLPGDADRAWTHLAPGNWYFSLRTEDQDEQWTSTAHLGPFMIRGDGPTPTITASPTVTPTGEATPAPTRPRTQPPAVAPSATPIIIRPPTATQQPAPPPPTATRVPPTATQAPPPTPTP
ncbi:MAG: sigma-70 family RNA polymerase sigma factor [Dehalococcoidia bacterium]